MSSAARSQRQLSGPSDTGLPRPWVAAILLILLAVVFWWAGAFQPTGLPHYATSTRQITGMALMLISIPPYMVVASWFGQRRSLALLDQLRPLLPDGAVVDDAAASIRGALQKTWRIGLPLGFVLGLFNTNPIESFQRENAILEGSLSLGQLNMWMVIGLLIGVRATAARAFRGIAEVIPLDLMRPDHVKALARSGVVDAVIIAGAMMLTPLQSLDAEFRWYNYRFGLLVAVPAVTFLLVWPLQPLHRRNREDRDARIARIDGQIAELPAAHLATTDETVRLETLLAHRDRLRGARTWPLSMGLLSRVLLYLVIPPLAWAGAAIVERVVDTLLAG